ncbi:MAG: WGR domain-containing protein [Xanthomonadales bacterium]|nr:WGR domain-containing protein [Xanthomonadales bacterium]
MRMFLQQPPATGAPPRFCQLILQADLLGGYTLMRESGEIGGRSQVRRSVHPDRDSAVAAFEAARDREIRRGLRITFAEGAQPPSD